MSAPTRHRPPQPRADAIGGAGFGDSAASRPASLWPSSLRPDDLPSTGFSATGFGPGDAAVLRPAPSPVFDVCHVGVVLRALGVVFAVVAVGAAFGANGLAHWVARSTAAAAIAWPGLMLWLLLACGAKRLLAPLPLAAQWLAAAGLGALCGALASVLTGLYADDPLAPPNAMRWIAPTLAGAALAAALFQWLRLRGEALLPAHTSARLAELQSRIRPHFLFNTLNTALTLVRLDPERAEVVLEDLAELFRVAISDGGASTTLADEIDLARRYLAIEQIRFGRRLRVTWELDPDAGGAKLPPLLLQPLVENAVRHGVEPADDGGALRIRTRVRLGRVLISIVNTLPAEPSQPGHGMALHNVRERLRLMHDVAAQFDARQDAQAFRVDIVVPL
ncbi:MAG: histidine kinase [Burkholderiaceae bacterium]